MTKEFIQMWVTKFQHEINHLSPQLRTTEKAVRERISNNIKLHRELQEWISQHHVMQEGKDEMKIYNAPHGLAGILPSDDEEPELTPCAVCGNPTPPNIDCGFCEVSTEPNTTP